MKTFSILVIYLSASLLLLASPYEMRKEYQELLGQLFRHILKDPDFYALPSREQQRILKTMLNLLGKHSSQIPLSF
jgi:hypothetical protein